MRGELFFGLAHKWCYNTALWCHIAALLQSRDEVTSAEPPTRQKALSVYTSLLIYRFVAENGIFVSGMQRRNKTAMFVSYSRAITF